jgi:hypothetical protein
MNLREPTFVFAGSCRSLAVPKTRKLAFIDESHFVQLSVGSVAIAAGGERGPVVYRS